MKKLSQFILVVFLVLLPVFGSAQTSIGINDISHNLYFGLKNSEVLILQQKLQKLGYFSDSLKPSGYFGLVTKKAVQNFQKANLISPTGYVGPLTLKALAHEIKLPTMCEYPAPPQGCSYIQGSNYIPTTSCGMVLSCLKPLSQCLPADTKLSDVVDTKFVRYNSKTGVYDVEKTTVEQKLSEIKATCSNDNKLVDSLGRQITFYRLTGCWGNPPENSSEILQKQRDELNRLKEQYTVIEMTCNASGVPVQ